MVFTIVAEEVSTPGPKIGKTVPGSLSDNAQIEIDDRDDDDEFDDEDDDDEFYYHSLRD